MRLITLEAASAVYSCSSNIVVRHHRVSHDAFREFSFRLRNFERALGEEVENEYWRTFVRRLKRYRFETTAAPLPFGNRVLMPPELLGWLDDHLRQCRDIYSPFADASGELIASLKRLVEANENPLLTSLDEIAAETSEGLAVLIKESRLIPLLEDVLKANFSFLRNLEIVSESQLTGGTCYEELACIGPSRWFKEHIFIAPRAPRIHVLHFNWIRDQWRPSAVFIGSAKGRAISQTSDSQRVTGDNEQAASADDSPRERYLEVDELTLTLDLTQISNRFARANTSATTGFEHEDTEARLFQLEGKAGVFLDAEDGSTALVIDMEEEEQGRVKRITTSAIEPGMYILLRAGGGGDYIIPVADKILGERADSRRKFQRLWKAKLHEAVRANGAYVACQRLKSFGSTRANEVNLRNWMSERNIRTEDPRDFHAIMQLVGLGADAVRCWQIAGEIDRAHRQAGRHIRRLLLRQVLASDLRELEQRGRMQFELSDSGGASVVAMRVVAIAPTVTRISLSHLGRQFELEETLWRE